MYAALNLALVFQLILASAALAASTIYHYDGMLPRNLTLTNSLHLYPLIHLQEYAATARCFPDIANSSYFQLCFVNTTFNAYSFSILTYDTSFPNAPTSYIKTSTAKVVWSANRNNLVREDAVVRFEEDGNLSLREDDGSLVWSTNTSNQGVFGISLDNWGNLVLYNSTNGTIWQSYDHPTDVLLQRQGLYPGMRLVSRVSDTDGSEGSYSLVMEAGGLVAYYNNPSSNESDPYWVFGCHGENDLFSVQHTCNDSFYLDFDGGNTPYLQFFNVPNSSAVLKDESLKAPQLCKLNTSTCSKYGWYFDVSSSTFTKISSLTYFLRLESSGFLQAYVYCYVNGDSSVPIWLNKTVLVEDTDTCLPPDTCGAYGVCSTMGGSACTCPVAANNSLIASDSFIQIQNPLLDKFAGCSPPRNLSCAKNTSSTANLHQHFLNLSGIDYFANTFALPQTYTSLEDCLKICLYNCSCLAAFYHNHTGSCFPYSDELASLRSVNNQSFLAFLKIEGTDNPSHKSRVGIVVGSVIGVLAGICMSVGVIWLCCRKRKRQAEEEEEDDDDEASFLEKLSTLPTRYSYGDLKKITQSFGKTLGEGGFGKVYEGMLPNGNRVAVKKLESKRQGKKEFRAEVAILGGIHHVNLVRLCGFCAEGSSRLLVYEYMQNGSLDKWLFHDVEEPDRCLNWSVRFQIALGTARGLAYLHNECTERIYHLDVKPQNILLDADFTAKVGDFGLSRLVKRDESFVETTMRGTRGYLAPEWLLQGGITEKADVYSFGMVLLEIVSRQKIINLLNRITPDLFPLKKLGSSPEEIGQEVMTELTNNADEQEQAHRMIVTAFHCIQEDPTMRPSMDKVPQMLEGAADIAHLDVSELYQGICSALRTGKSRPCSMQIMSSTSSSATNTTAAPSGGFRLSLSVEAR